MNLYTSLHIGSISGWSMYSWNIRYLVDWPSDQKPTTYKSRAFRKNIKLIFLKPYLIGVANINHDLSAELPTPGNGGMAVHSRDFTRFKITRVLLG